MRRVPDILDVWFDSGTAVWAQLAPGEDWAKDGSLRAEFITREGDQEYECPGWMNGHEVRYFLPEGVTVKSARFRETGYNAEFVGKFETDDARLNMLWEKARRTLYVTMRDNYMDCPDRERGQWWNLSRALQIGRPATLGELHDRIAGAGQIVGQNGDTQGLSRGA